MSASAIARTKLTPPELAKQWGLSVDKILAWVHSGELRATNVATKLGGRPRFLIDLADVAAFEARRSAVVSPPPKTRRHLKQEADVIEFF
jgi:excisionase family DNA binding protein